MLFLCALSGGAKTAAAADYPGGDDCTTEETPQSDSLDWLGQFPDNERPSPRALLDEIAQQHRIVFEQWKQSFSHGGKVGGGVRLMPTVSLFYGSPAAAYARRSLQVLFCRWAV